MARLDNVKRALELGYEAYEEQEPLLAAAFDAVDFPKFGDDVFASAVYADPAQLTAAQRRLCESFLDVEFHSAAIGGYAVPHSVATRRRWLGADLGGRLEKRITFEKRSTPIWRALQLARAKDARRGVAKVMNALPIAARLEVLAELGLREQVGAAIYDLDSEEIVEDVGAKILTDVRGLRDRGAAWARATLSHAASFESFEMATELYKLLFRVLVRAKEPILPEWEKLVPCMPLEDLAPILRAIPRERRDVAIPLISAKAPNEVAYLLELAPDFPSRALFERLVRLAPRYDYSLKKLLPKLQAAAGRDASLLDFVKRQKR